MMKTEQLDLVQVWDKVFPRDERTEHCKVTFANRYGITLAADLYKPKGAQGKLAAIAVSGPFGAVKEQSSGLYAQEMAARGFLAIAFDPSFTGESGGQPRRMASPDINTEDYYAYYKTPRGYHERSGNSNDGWNVTGTISFLNQPILSMAGEIDAPVLLVHGEKAHSRYFSEGAYQLLQGDNKELMIIDGASHVDLYDNFEAIPFDKLESFFGDNLR